MLSYSVREDIDQYPFFSSFKGLITDLRTYGSILLKRRREPIGYPNLLSSMITDENEFGTGADLTSGKHSCPKNRRLHSHSLPCTLFKNSLRSLKK